MNFERFSGMLSAVGILLICAIVGWLGVTGPIWNAGWQATPDQWLGFAGSIVGAAMTIVAALVAWFAVSRQISANADLAQEERDRVADREASAQAEAKFAAVIVLTQTVHAVAAVCFNNRQVVSLIANKTGDDFHLQRINNAIDTLHKSVEALRVTMGHFAVAEVWKTLNINDKTNYLIVVSTLDTLVHIYRDPPGGDRELLVHNQQQTLDNLSVFLRAFDSELADIYDRDSKGIA